jgi:hypothetical protein
MALSYVFGEHSYFQTAESVEYTSHVDLGQGWLLCLNATVALGSKTSPVIVRG